MERQLALKYSQNYLKDKALAEKLIASKSSITKDDLVLDIGAGQGTLTRELLKHARKVIAYELDPYNVKFLKQQFPTEQLTIIEGDFLEADLSSLTSYKVFANIPFFLSAAIVRKLFLENKKPPEEAHIFLQRETALRFLGAPYSKDLLLPLLIKPFFQMRISHTFSHSDFKPAPNVSVVLLSFVPLEEPLVKKEERQDYYEFLSYVLNERKQDIKHALMDLFSYNQLKIISRELALNLSSSPGSLELNIWLALFQRFKKLVSLEKQSRTKGAFEKLKRHQFKQNRDKTIIL